MKNKGLRLEEKFILVIVAVGLICFSLLGFLSYKQVGRIIVDQHKEDAMGIARTAADQIDGEMFANITSSEDENYKVIYELLSKYKANNLISYIYAMKQEGDHLVFVIDTDEQNPADFLEEYEYLADMRPAFDGDVCCDEEVTTDKWGDYFSAYAPIVDKDGKVVGIVGADIGIDSIDSVLAQLKNLIIMLITVFAAISILVYILISSNLMNKDLLTEINNYEKLIKVGSARYKRKKLDNYTGILINIKDFSYINQQLGSAGGDMILKLYAKELQKRGKHLDLVASIGGDSYFALIKNERAQQFLDSIKGIVLSIKVNNDFVDVQVNARCGIYPIPEKTRINEVLNCCTVALNEAKLQYDNDYKWFEKEMFDQMLEEREILNAFRVGIVRHEFVVYYQPKVNLYTNNLCGAEALVRWFRNGKIVPPDQFIPVLEKNNLITELDFYVFEKVCKDIRDWLDKGYEMVTISSNFSKMHLRNANFADDILKIKDKYNVDSKYIDTELTESSGLNDLEALIKFVTKMNEAKISVSIDDFGTGYSSLSLLKDLNVDVVKMDKSFFRAMENGERLQKKMVENVIRMVQDLDREVISEGIETEQQADFLRSIDSPIVQGYLFDKPLPHNEFEKRLKEPHYLTLEEKEALEKAESESKEENIEEKKEDNT